MADESDFDFDIDISEIDFGLDGLDLDFDTDYSGAPDDNKIVLPKLGPPQKVKYENARTMARQLDLVKNANYYAMVSGNFILGDIIEAWADKHRFKNISVATLGMGVNNVDSLINCLYKGAAQVNLIVSVYFFGVERHRLIRYISEEIQGLPFRVAVARSHCKIILLETDDLHITVHGSANLSSNNSLEQISITENKELFNFNMAIFNDILEKQTIMDGAGVNLKNARAAKDTWEVVNG